MIGFRLSQRARKPLRWLWRCLWGLYVAALGSFLLVGIRRNAPPRVLYLLAVLLVLAAVVPRKWRKYVRLLGVTVLAVLVVWVLLPESDEGWRPFAFEQEFADLNAEYVSAEGNALTLYDAIRCSLDGLRPTLSGDPNEPGFFPPSLDLASSRRLLKTAWPSDAYPELAQWIHDRQLLIDQLLEASQKPHCVWPLSSENLIGDVVDGVIWLRPWAVLLVHAGNLAIGSGEYDRAVEHFEAVLRMGGQLRNSTPALVWLVGLSLESMAYEAFSRFAVLTSLDPARLGAVKYQVNAVEYDWATEWRRLVDAEKVIGRSFVAALFYEIHDDGRLRFSRRRVMFDTSFTRTPGEREELTYLERRWTKVRAVLAWFVLPSSPSETVALLDGHYYDMYRMAEPDYDWDFELAESRRRLDRSWYDESAEYNLSVFFSFLPKIVTPLYYHLHNIHLEQVSRRRATLLIVTLCEYRNRFGHWPDGLDEFATETDPTLFVDSLNGGSFIYEKHEGGFRLYSTGKDGVDDGGVKDNETGCDDILFWPQDEDR